tara:strand:- start:209 stop:721 length:513 start_codon:yes stop_codon:yes gene_type:complete
MFLGPTNFKVIRGMLTGELLDFLGVYAYNIATLPDAIPSGKFVDNQVPNTPAFYNDLVMKNLLCYLLPDMKKHTGIDLIPTYAYLRVYKIGDELKKHTDRNSCEISVTLTLRRELNEDIWPIYVETDTVHKVELEMGDGLIYKGIESPHWRDKFEGSGLAQVFLHYVRRT